LFHSEVAGIVGILYTLTFWPPKSNKPPFHLACDKLSVITHLTTLQPIDLTEPHMDLLVAACNLINQSEYLVQIMFVCGHQDMGNPTVLSRDMWLNVEGDQLAKHKTSLPHIGPLYYKLPGYPWGCYLGKQHVIKQLQHSLWKFINGKDMLKYWEQWKQSLQDLLQEVDWQSLGCAIQSIPLSKHRWSTKQMSGHFAHGKNMVRLQQRSTAEFPQCRMTIEDKTHIIRCTQAEATSTWTVAITDLTQWMKDEQTDPQLITALTLGLQAWWQGMPSLDESPTSHQQLQVVCDAALDRWLGLEWKAQQEAYWSLWRQKKSSKHWAVELIKKLWNVSWDMCWDHWNGILHHEQQSREDILDSRINN